MISTAWSTNFVENNILKCLILKPFFFLWGGPQIIGNPTFFTLFGLIELLVAKLQIFLLICLLSNKIFWGENSLETLGPRSQCDPSLVAIVRKDLTRCRVDTFYELINVFSIIRILHIIIITILIRTLYIIIIRTLHIILEQCI